MAKALGLVLILFLIPTFVVIERASCDKHGGCVQGKKGSADNLAAAAAAEVGILARSWMESDCLGSVACYFD